MDVDAQPRYGSFPGTHELGGYQVLWLWLAIDPLTKILPVLHLGPRSQNVAHLLIHSLRQILAAFLPPNLHQ